MTSQAKKNQLKTKQYKTNQNRIRTFNMTETKKGIVPELCDETNILIDNTEDISQLLEIWNEINTGLKKIETTNDKIKTKIKNFLKERKWKQYKDEKTKISITIIELKKEQIDKIQLKIMLSDNQYAQVSNIKIFERLNIITEKRRMELNKIVRK